MQRLDRKSGKSTSKLCHVKIVQNTLLKTDELLSTKRQRLRDTRVATDI